MIQKALLWIFIILTLGSCTIKFKSGLNKDREFPDLIFGDFKYISADNSGMREFELIASLALMFQPKEEIYLYNFTMTFFNESNEIKSFLSANSGYIDKSNMNVFAEGKVKILSENQTLLEANKVYWKNESKQFYTEPGELVTITRGNSIITGYDLLADNELNEVKLFNVIGSLNNDETNQKPKMPPKIEVREEFSSATNINTSSASIDSTNKESQ